MRRRYSVPVAALLMVALIAMIAMPAMAQRFDRDDFFRFHDGVSNEIGQEAESGDVDVSFEVSSSGDYSMQCVAPLQFANSGNLQNGQAALQYFSTSDDIEFDGSSFEFFTGPGADISTTCDQSVQQSAAASG